MADESKFPQETATRVIDALSEVLRTGGSPEAAQIQQLLLRRLALEGDVVPSRIPAPRNITEIGGYLNLLEKLRETEMRKQMLASVLGVAGSIPVPPAPPAPVLFDVLRSNDRPTGSQQQAIPTQYRVRTDFAAALDAAMTAIHAAGCQVPFLGGAPGLPPALPGSSAPEDLLKYLGRTLEIVPTAALLDPDTDAIAVAHLDGDATLHVCARQLDAKAPNAGSIKTQKWAAYRCDASTATEETGDRALLPLTAVLNAAGWYQETLGAPASLARPGNWNRWTNVTGLVFGVTRLADELSLRYSQEEIAFSSIRNAWDWVWNGQTFVPKWN